MHIHKRGRRYSTWAIRTGVTADSRLPRILLRAVCNGGGELPPPTNRPRGRNVGLKGPKFHCNARKNAKKKKQKREKKREKRKKRRKNKRKNRQMEVINTKKEKKVSWGGGMFYLPSPLPRYTRH
jgi:hypothetical protein